MTQTLILGLGNSILTDDGVGIYVARLLAERLKDRPDVAVAEACVGGLRLLEMVGGYARLILVDAIQTASGQPGAIYRLTPDDFADPRRAASLHSGCSHDMDLFTALEFGRQLGMALPKEFVIIAIEARDVITFAERCTPEIEAAIPAALQAVLAEIGA
jgi:hydrogenase maturation protease